MDTLRDKERIPSPQWSESQQHPLPRTIVVGVRHQTAPIEIREKLAFREEEIPELLQRLVTYPGIQEGAILSTCNRSELYVAVTETDVGRQSVRTFLMDVKQFDVDRYQEFTFTLLHEEAVLHLFRVASGMDSLIFGEDQIMAQVKTALHHTMDADTAGHMIEKIFKTALSVGKAVRTETDISKGRTSVAKAAFDFAKQLEPQLLQKKIAVIGTGTMAQIVMTCLQEARFEDQPHDQLVVVSRTLDRARVVAEQYGILGCGWRDVDRVIQEYDTLFVATDSHHALLGYTSFQQVSTPKVIIDISVPRNVDPVVGNYPNISLYNTDDLSGYSGYTPENKLRLESQAQMIITREYQRFHDWLVSRFAAPVISTFRSQVEEVRRQEVASLAAHCPQINKSCSMIDELSKTLVNKILHDPTMKLRSTPQMEEIYRQAEFLQTLFNLPETPVCHDESAASNQGEQPALIGK